MKSDHSLQSNFIAIGFSEKEAEILAFISHKGEVPIALISRNSSLKRTTVYMLVEALNQRGVLRIIKRKNIKYVSMVSPDVLHEDMKHQLEDDIAERKQRMTQLDALIHSLQSIEEQQWNPPKVQVFEGRDGLQSLLSSLSHAKTTHATLQGEWQKIDRDNFVSALPQDTQVIELNNKGNASAQVTFDEEKVAFIFPHKTDRFGMIIRSKTMHDSIQSQWKLLFDEKISML